MERDNSISWFCRTIFNFNSHAHVERDDRDTIWQLRRTKFQLTRSRGAWRISDEFLYAAEDFNSHAHVERDIDRVAFGAETAISTHTLTWSVTVCVCVHFFGLIISTHTLTWSVTKFPQDHRKFWYISTHTLTWSVTPEIRKTGLKTFYFNSHAHVERDVCLYFEL